MLFNDTEIAFKPKVMFLGIYITENLKWNVHVLSLCSSLSKVPYIIKSVKAVLSPYMLRSFCFAYFQSQFRYGRILKVKGHWKYKRGSFE